MDEWERAEGAGADTAAAAGVSTDVAATDVEVERVARELVERYADALERLGR